MIDLEYTIKSEDGIHTRPAGYLAKFAQNCPVSITISHSNKECDVKNILSVMKLGLKQNDIVTFHLDSTNGNVNEKNEIKEKEAKEKLDDLLKNLGLVEF